MALLTLALSLHLMPFLLALSSALKFAALFLVAQLPAAEFLGPVSSPTPAPLSPFQLPCLSTHVGGYWDTGPGCSLLNLYLVEYSFPYSQGKIREGLIILDMTM